MSFLLSRCCGHFHFPQHRSYQFGNRLLTNAKFLCSSGPNLPTPDKGKLPPSKYSRENVRRYVFHRFIDYVSNYDKLLEKKFPNAMQIYRVFLSGVRDFYEDMKKYLKIARIVNYTSAKGMRALTRKEIELYLQLPKDMRTVAPVLLLSALPFANYVIFPLAYLYPRLLLTSHFWSETQKLEFRETFLKQRFAANRKVFRYLQSKNSVQHLSGDTDCFTKLNYILGLLGSGLHPTAEEVLEVKHIFAKPPFRLESLVSGHLNCLCQLHGLHGMWMKRFRLSEHSFLIHHMDLAIKREGGVHNMPLEALQHSCYLRGLNPAGISNEDMIVWLNEWIKVSLHIDSTNISLFLHLPILLGYNHPNNWILLHK